MSGIVLTDDVVTGIIAGAGYSFESINATVNNAFLWTAATMFIGFAIVVGLVVWLVKGHRRI